MIVDDRQIWGILGMLIKKSVMSDGSDGRSIKRIALASSSLSALVKNLIQLSSSRSKMQYWEGLSNSALIVNI